MGSSHKSGIRGGRKAGKKGDNRKSVPDKSIGGRPVKEHKAKNVSPNILIGEFFSDYMMRENIRDQNGKKRGGGKGKSIQFNLETLLAQGLSICLQ